MWKNVEKERPRVGTKVKVKGLNKKGNAWESTGYMTKEGKFTVKYVKDIELGYQGITHWEDLTD